MDTDFNFCSFVIYEMWKTQSLTSKSWAYGTAVGCKILYKIWPCNSHEISFEVKVLSFMMRLTFVILDVVHNLKSFMKNGEYLVSVNSKSCVKFV